MNKKTKIIIISVIVVLAILCGIFVVYKNYQYGKEMYTSVLRVRYQCMMISLGIDSTRETFQDPDVDPEGINTYSFSDLLTATQVMIGYEDMALTDDVQIAYKDRIRHMQSNYLGSSYLNMKISDSFTDPEKAAEVETFKNELDNLVAAFNDFVDRYNEMSFLERCFTSWSHEREELSEKVRLP